MIPHIRFLKVRLLEYYKFCSVEFSGFQYSDSRHSQEHMYQNLYVLEDYNTLGKILEGGTCQSMAYVQFRINNVQ